ncbi:unnamed protein product [marine sediment metagenome]|uniref:Uncharacterized protein n=1 Tax=marine sediment metagenome TaxID=412755 RepID=X1CG20_9ZZZZ
MPLCGPKFTISLVPFTELPLAALEIAVADPGPPTRRLTLFVQNTVSVILRPVN